MTGAEMIAAERQRQIEVEGWTPEHDAEHNKGELAAAAACYARATQSLASTVTWLNESGPEWAYRRYPEGPERDELLRAMAEDRRDILGFHFGRDDLGRVKPPQDWPWDAWWWKPTLDPVRQLVKAGALIAAEIDRLRALDGEA